eukprot:TRINITY_DN377_c0_g1_i1.p1 TRINITY_DN377_c0_g1~~TRINITY_DN377_c0_g1_i1.p1  ORF type:complete len:394 (-),score=67.66 TRINITY_DN377_c0_g1_i1:363-1544(-)
MSTAWSQKQSLIRTDLLPRPFQFATGGKLVTQSLRKSFWKRANVIFNVSNEQISKTKQCQSAIIIMSKSKINFRNKKRKQLSDNVKEADGTASFEETDFNLIPKPTKRQKKQLSREKLRNLSDESKLALRKKVVKERFEDVDDLDDDDDDNGMDEFENYDTARESSYDGDDDEDDENQEEIVVEQGSTFSQAFDAILKAPSKAQRQKKNLKKEPSSQNKAVYILQESNELQDAKQKAKQETENLKQKRKMKQEMRHRGHAKVPKKGENVEVDVVEKQLQRVATRGVVQLFNAIAKAQKVQRDARATRGRASAAKMTKASIAAELKKAKKNSAQQVEDLNQGSGWKVLQDNYTGLPASQNMKDWENELENDFSDEDRGPEAMQLDDSGADDSDD